MWPAGGTKHCQWPGCTGRRPTASRCAARKRSTNENESSKFAEQSDSEAAGNAARRKKTGTTKPNISALDSQPQSHTMSIVSIQKKLPNLPVTIFAQMSQLARDYQAVNLGQGFPDFAMDGHLQALVQQAMRDGHNQYAHTNGYAGLREVLAAKANGLYGANINPETDITITPGGTYAISNALTAMLHPGDEVILFEPSFDSYIPNIEVMGARAVAIPLQFPDYSIPWAEVKSKISEKTRFILINSPHNPTGALLSEADIEALRAVVSGTNIMILSDEVYEHLVFDGHKHLSLLAYPDLFERSFVAFSLGKVFHCTGWKIGYTMAPAYLMQEFRNHHQFNVFSVNTPYQVAMAEYLQNPAVYLGLAADFQRRRDLLLSLTKGLPLQPLASKGSYFQCFTFNSEASDADLALRMVTEGGVAAIPVSAFYRDKTDHRVLRFCFAKKESTLEAAAERLQKFRF